MRHRGSRRNGRSECQGTQLARREELRSRAPIPGEPVNCVWPSSYTRIVGPHPGNLSPLLGTGEVPDCKPGRSLSLLDQLRGVVPQALAGETRL